eukprot:CAMPEP_0114671156 /NCGR_PEP_ID=MMETSP0191-20121206/40679_1 /TAXON_ID=126664 /ORGANISM="Sorites sp." /LENGTH=364 /DNA_ID=CAMNT_0001930323 /DNA_START=37 /DNA_END=1131 /DNA_ORIENTATION=+
MSNGITCILRRPRSCHPNGAMPVAVVGAPAPPVALPVTRVQAVVQAPEAPAQPDIEDMVKHDPLFAQGLQSQRRQQLGLDKPQLQEFLSRTNLISLGSYCAVANTFESLGLRDAAGPFDWMRSDCQGITHLVKNGFEDFLEWEGTSHKIGSLDVFPMKWGGSFWHHDIRDEQVKETFRRRTQRFLNAKNDNLLFIRVLNGTQELSCVKALYQALQQRFAESRVRLLVLIDLQNFEQDVVALDLGPDVIFSCVHHQSWEGPLNGSPEEQARQRLHVASDAYSLALVRALHIWCNCGSLTASWPTVDAFSQHLVPWLGTDPRRDSYQPTRVTPRRVAVATAVTLNAATLMTQAANPWPMDSTIIRL